MRISAKGEYALRALHYLSLNYGKGLIHIKDIAENQKIPLKFLEGILLKLKNAGYLSSKRGARGGYFLAKPPGSINIAEIMRSMDIPLTPIDCVNDNASNLCDHKENCDLIWLWRDIKNKVEEILENTTFEDLCVKNKNQSKRIAI
ncbi:MAG TPA: Rrf2 family transcriptional regulator [Nitrospinota bacterium]|nr:Rrf2 family transcriptional regulator [Nitrospinota bacterium]